MSASKLNEPAMIQELIAQARRTMPSVIADEITSVQPMTNSRMSLPIKKWEKIGMDVPTDKWVYNVRAQEIRDWIEAQPIHMWNIYDIDRFNKDTPISAIMGENYIFTEEMEAWFTLRWS